MSKKGISRYVKPLITLADVTQIDYTPEKARARETGRYGARQCVDACILLEAHPMKQPGKGYSGNKWRRIYNDGRMYLWIAKQAHYLDAELSARVLDVLLDQESWHATVDRLSKSL